MVHLPQKGCIEASPFRHCGMDLFGPFIIKRRRSKINGYATLFIPFPSCAVHIEVTSSLDANFFIIDTRIFMSSGGLVCSIRTENGSNFVGANNELKKELKEIKHEKIKPFNKRRM